MATQAERDQTYREKQRGLGFVRICSMFPMEYRQQLEKYVAKKRREWERQRDAK